MYVNSLISRTAFLEHCVNFAHKRQFLQLVNLLPTIVIMLLASSGRVSSS